MKLLTHTSTAALVTAGAVLSAVMIIATPAFAAEAPGAKPVPKPRTTAQSTYDKDRADCLAGRTAQDVKTCLKEAGAARDEARRGNLRTNSTQELANNALLRCQRVPEGDREDCRAMVMGQGTRDGSVADGAILKRIDRMVEENPTAAGPAPEPAPTPRPGAPVPRAQQPKASAPK